jgi:signal transduction histidine kinase/CheY-like chemotaxis protein
MSEGSISLPKTGSGKTYLALALTSICLSIIIGALYLMHRSSGNSISASQQAQTLAAGAFNLGNRLGEIVQSDNMLRASWKRSPNASAMADSLQLFRQQVTLLKPLLSVQERPAALHLLTRLDEQLSNFDALTKASPADRTRWEALLKKGSDSIYTISVKLQSAVESDLQSAFRHSQVLSARAAWLNRLLTILAMIVIATLGSLLIYWILRQLSLIRTLAREKARADHLSAVKEQFLANMSHEIRTPINAVIGFAGLMQKKTLPPDLKEHVGLIHASGKNLLAIVNDILDMSKLDAGKMRFTRELFSPADVCNHILLLFGPRAEEKSIELRLDLDPAIPEYLYGDADRLTQVLNNLVGNAVKFTAAGSVVLEVKGLDDPATNTRVQLRISVRDSGIGISTDQLATIFDRFVQAQSQGSHIYGGTGLGLSIVKQVVEQQNGSIKAQSREGHGAEFIVQLGYDIAVMHEEPVQAGDGEAHHNENFSGLHALVVEDNRVNQILIRALLAQWNLGVTIAGDGKEAIGLIAKQQFDIILLDMQMPVLDGYETAKIIRGELKLSLPIVAMTAHVLDGEREKCLALGMNDYLPKPLNEATLRDTLSRYLHRSVSRETRDSVPFAGYVNPDYLKRTFGMDTIFCRELLTQFSVQFPQELTNLENAISLRDAGTVQAIAHSMISTTSVLDADCGLRVLLSSLESDAIAGKWPQVGAGLADLQRHRDAFEPEMNIYLASESAHTMSHSETLLL